MVRKFGIESILIYIAVLLKKRVVVVCPDVEELLELMRTLPQFVFSRQDWSILFPHVAMSDAEMDDLAAATGPYIAGSVAAPKQTQTHFFGVCPLRC